MYTVQVFLSTYNGEAYLISQLNSILNQKDVNVKLLIRDDGSTDETPSMLREYANEHENVSYIYGKNHGVTASFFRLFELADESCDYYAFADQDDVWDEDKLITACNKLAETDSNIPALYCCESIITDINLSPINNNEAQRTLTPDFKNALIENIARGGSIVINKLLLTSVQIPMPDGIYMHDWWLYLVASCFGTVIYDSTPHYKYRQHNNNVLGAASNSLISRYKRRIKQSRENGGHILMQAKAFARTYKLPEEKQESLNVILNYRDSTKYRLKGIFGKHLFRQSKSDNFVFHLLFFTNHI